MSEFVAGIDGGQSSTVAVIGDADGRIVGRGIAGPADEVGERAGSTRLRDALHDALAAARREAALPARGRFATVVAGVSGYDGRLTGRAPSPPARRFRLLHDAPVAHAGAFALGPGVLVLAGTGSVVYTGDGISAGSTSGGWGYLFGDEGSALWIAREALAALMREDDEGAAEPSRESAAALAFFGAASLRALARSFYCGEITRAGLARFAPEAMRFKRFAPILERGAQRLASLARSSTRATSSPAVACAGGAFADAAYRRLVETAIRATGAQVVAPRYEPAAGALLLAYREAGIRVGEVRA